MPAFAIIIPCFNEAQRLLPDRFISFGKAHTHTRYIFVNDGSTDGTAAVLEGIRAALPQTEVITLQKNSGKGEAVRTGIRAAIETGVPYCGYLDADLSTSLEEFEALHRLAHSEGLDLVLASRIKKIDTVIQRSFTRHLIGRVLATVIDKKFNLGVYDTQCGAKVFRTAIAAPLTEAPFQTSWFFDVELLLRLKRSLPGAACREIPLSRWKDAGNSKIGILSFPGVLKELVTLLTRY